MSDKNEAPEVLHGVCEFYSETGTEGGYWAFQDLRYITQNVARGYCKKCGKWLREQEGAIRVTRVTLLTPENVVALSRGEKLSKQPYCSDDAHEEDIGESWSYDGLHILEDGDRLIVYAPENHEVVVWAGTVSLKQLPLFTEHAFGMWIHADQKDIPRDIWAIWFVRRYPATLKKAKKQSGKTP